MKDEHIDLVPMKYVRAIVNLLINDRRLLKKEKKNKEFGTEIDVVIEGILNNTIYMDKKEFKKIKTEQEMLEKL